MSSAPDTDGEAFIETMGVADRARRHGPQILDRGVLFNLWAPSATSVELLEAGQASRRMSCDDEGWYQVFSATAHPGSRYQFRINGELVVPDPASCFQPEDVSEPSEVVDITLVARSRSVFRAPVVGSRYL